MTIDLTEEFEENIEISESCLAKRQTSTYSQETKRNDFILEPSKLEKFGKFEIFEIFDMEDKNEYMTRMQAISDEGHLIDIELTHQAHRYWGNKIKNHKNIFIFYSEIDHFSDIQSTQNHSDWCIRTIKGISLSEVPIDEQYSTLKSEILNDEIIGKKPILARLVDCRASKPDNTNPNHEYLLQIQDLKGEKISILNTEENFSGQHFNMLLDNEWIVIEIYGTAIDKDSKEKEKLLIIDSFRSIDLMFDEKLIEL